MEFIISNYNMWIVFFLMMLGFYIMITSGNLAKKLIGMVIFQTSVLLFYITLAKISPSIPPILPLDENGQAITANLAFTNPLPHVLMLTAIVVGVALLAVGLALVVRIKETYGTIEEDDILLQEEE